MGETVKGTGVVWGAAGHTFTGGLVGLTGPANSIRFTRDSQVVDVMDGDGQTIGKVFYNKRKAISASIVPLATNVSLAVAAMVAGMAASGVAVTVADSDGVYNDTYNLLSAVLNRTPTGVAVIDVELEAFDDADVTTDAS